MSKRRQLSLNCETLEDRNLLSNIPGVSQHYGCIFITATKPGGNVAEVSIDPANNNVKVSLNGQTEEFRRSSVGSVTYVGGKSGGDTFVNDTNLLEIAKGYGNHNNFTGGTSICNVIYFVGNSDTYNAQAGSKNYIYEAGTNDAVHKAAGAQVNVTVYPKWMWRYLI